MPRRTKKQENFVSEPVRNKRVEDLPGIGAVYGGRLRKAGYTTASDVLDQYSKNPDGFEHWLRGVTSSNRASHTSGALNEYW